MIFILNFIIQTTSSFSSFQVTGDAVDHTVILTGNYSACIRMASLESIYMDNNLAPGSQPGDNEGRVSMHTTEETQNHQDDLCHNVLTGKVKIFGGMGDFN